MKKRTSTHKGRFTGRESAEGFSPASLLAPPILHFLAIAAILLLVLLCYGNTFDVPFILDDVTSILGNSLVKDFHFTLKPRIVGDASFALNYAMSGLELAGYHAVNLAIHAAVCCVVYGLVLLLCRKLSTAGEANNGQVWRFVPLLVALLFAVHPLQTQAVTYISQRVASLAALFYLSAILLYLLARDAAGGRKVFLFTAAFAAGLLAILTKENAATLPLALILCEAVFLTGKGWRRFLPLVGCCGLLIFVVLGLYGGGKAGTLDSLARLTTDAPAISRGAYLATQCRVVLAYLRLLVLPVNQNLDYDFSLSASFAEPQVMGSLVVHLVLVGAAILLLWRGKRHGAVADQSCRVAGLGILWFYLTLAVESSLIPIRDVIFEHRLYLPAFGFFLAAAALMVMAVDRLRQRELRYAQTLQIIVWCLIPLLAFATVRRNEVWRDEQTLWEDVVRKSPAKARGHGSLAGIYQKRGLTGEAIDQYRAALSSDPADVAAHNNLGTIFLGQRRYTSARRLLSRAATLNPASAKARYNLGNVLMSLGDLKGAEGEYRAALALDPRNEQALNNLGLLFARRGEYKGAVAYFRRVLDINPGNRESQENLRRLQAAGF